MEQHSVFHSAIILNKKTAPSISPDGEEIEKNTEKIDDTKVKRHF